MGAVVNALAHGFFFAAGAFCFLACLAVAAVAFLRLLGYVLRNRG